MTIKIIGPYQEKTDDYTLELGDENRTTGINKATAVSLTVPPNSSEAFLVGTEIPIIQIGAGNVTIVAGAGVTVNTPDNLVLQRQYSQSVLRKIGTDSWVFIRYWLQAESTPPAAGNPDTNTPPGHWANMNINDGDTEQDYLGKKPSNGGVSNAQGVVRRVLWKTINPTLTTYDFTDVNAWLDLAEAGGYKLQLFPMWKTFNSSAEWGNPAPTNLDDFGGAETYALPNKASGGVTMAIHNATVRDQFIATMEALAAEVGDHPAFAGICLNESAPSYVTNLSAGDQDLYIANLELIYVAVSDAFPNQMVFPFLNHLNSTGVVETGQCYALVVDTMAAIALSDNNDNMCWSGPDVFPNSDGLELDASGNQDRDRIYTVYKNLEIDYPTGLISGLTLRFGGSFQNESWGCSYDIPNGSWAPPEGDSYWGVRELFLLHLEEFAYTYVFWNYKTTGAFDKYTPAGEAVHAEFPTWDRFVNLIPSTSRRDFTHADWVDLASPAGMATPTEDTSTRNGHNTLNTGQASFALIETAVTDNHGFQQTFAYTNFTAGDIWRWQAIVKKNTASGNDRDIQLDAKAYWVETDPGDPDFGTSTAWFPTARFDPSTESFFETQGVYFQDFGFQRCNDNSTGAEDEWYKIWMDFIPREVDTETGDVIVRLRLSDGAAQSYLGVITNTQYLVESAEFFKVY